MTNALAEAALCAARDYPLGGSRGHRRTRRSCVPSISTSFTLKNLSPKLPTSFARLAALCMARTRTSALTETRSAGKGQPSRPSPSGLASRSPTTTGITTPPVSGAEGREGFARLLDRIESNGVTIVVVEDASRFARDLVVQELGIALLDKRGVRPLTTSAMI
jgi:Resolvase, N terminal domain